MRIIDLQKALNTLGADPQLEEDGYMGPATSRAILWFQALAGLPADGIPGRETEAAINRHLAERGLAPAPASVRGVCIRGLGNRAFSEGMDGLAERLNRIPNVRFTVENMGLFFYENLSAIYSALESAARGGAKVIPIGHSMGGDEVWKICALLDAQGINVPLAVSVDPTIWGSPGGWLVTKNVERAGNFWQPSYPGGGRIRKASGSNASLHEQRRSEPHVLVDNAADVQGWIETEVRSVATT